MKPGENAAAASPANHELSNNGKIIIDQNIPIEELMGSVTAYNNVEGDAKSFQLRTSARVFKKMKLDSANNTATPVPVIPEKKETVKEEIKEVKKPFRPLWTPEDKNLFFEGLNEYGKDFEAIHLFILNKLKKKGLPETVIKTKDQIRHLYYRTWHKISKHLKFSEEVKKLAQELYGLINYGELRKKISFITEKTCIKLNELIYRGSVTIRVKGKAIRIRTPMCRALRKLNQLDEKIDDLKLPTRVTVEFQARDMKSWLHIQQMAQNPRLKTTVPLQKRVSSIIFYLAEKWRTDNAIKYEDIIKSATEDTKDLLPDEKSMESRKSMYDPILRLRPVADCNITLPTVYLSEFLTTQSLCLNAYEERAGVKMPGEKICQSLFASFRTTTKGSTRKGGTKRSRNESTSDKSVNQNTTNHIDNNDNCVQQQDVVENHKTPPDTVNEVVDQVVNKLLSLHNDFNESADEVDHDVDENVSEIKTESEEEVKKILDIEKIKCGWTINDCGSLCVGDLYLMFGCDSKIVLEYSWDTPIPHDTTQFNREKPVQDGAQDKTVDATTQPNADSGDEDTSKIEQNEDLANTLKRLISVAKLHYRKNIIKCPCGHVCNGTKQNTSKTKPVLNKVAKAVSEHKTQETEITTTNDLNATPKSYQPITPAPVFRMPTVPYEALKAQLDSIQRLKPRYCNRKGRPRAKQMFVERKLPVLANKGEAGRQILQMNIVTQENIIQPRVIAPKLIELIPNNENQMQSNANFVSGVIGNVQTFQVLQPESSMRSVTETALITDNATTSSRVSSPTNLSNFVEMEISARRNTMLMDAITKNETKSELSFAGILSEDADHPTPPSSPSQILKESDQWLNSEVVDFSLSSLLGQLESPIKAPQQQQTVLPASDDSRLSLPQDMDAQLQSLMTDSSLDYVAKFADLAAQVEKK